MKVYESKEDLKKEINKAYEKYILEFLDIPEKLKDKKNNDIDRTPAENLAYQIGWTTLLLKWEKDSKLGLEVKTPSDKFKWNQLGELYHWFTKEYSHLSLMELKTIVKMSYLNLIKENGRTMPLKQQFGKYINLFT